MALDAGDYGEPLWLGSATFDRSVGVSHYTGQVTHHIAPDIDAERDLLRPRPRRRRRGRGGLSVTGVGPTVFARNGGGDPYFTDGEIAVSRLRPAADRPGRAADARPAAGHRRQERGCLAG